MPNVGGVQSSLPCEAATLDGPGSALWSTDDLRRPGCAISFRISFPP
jgi:hypothetical protein